MAQFLKKNYILKNEEKDKYVLYSLQKELIKSMNLFGFYSHSSLEKRTKKGIF